MPSSEQTHTPVTSPTSRPVRQRIESRSTVSRSPVNALTAFARRHQDTKDKERTHSSERPRESSCLFQSSCLPASAACPERSRGVGSFTDQWLSPYSSVNPTTVFMSTISPRRTMSRASPSVNVRPRSPRPRRRPRPRPVLKARTRGRTPSLRRSSPASGTSRPFGPTVPAPRPISSWHSRRRGLSRGIPRDRRCRPGASHSHWFTAWRYCLIRMTWPGSGTGRITTDRGWRIDLDRHRRCRAAARLARGRRRRPSLRTLARC